MHDLFMFVVGFLCCGMLLSSLKLVITREPGSRVRIRLLDAHGNDLF